LALRAERVDHAVRHDRHGARSLVEAEVVAIGGGIGIPPDRRARLDVERFDDLFVADAMEQDQLAV
jgi:hypothetical protein